MTEKKSASTRMISFRLPLEDADRLSEAVASSGKTRTEFIVERLDLYGESPPSASVPTRAHRPCPDHPDAGAVLSPTRRWVCREPGCPRVLS